MPDVMTFQDAIQSAGTGKKHLLLGNGFSIACKSDIFSYGALYDNADFSQAEEIPKIFDNLGTRDFENVIRSLDHTSRILKAYGVSDDALLDKIDEHRDFVKDVLVKTIAARHPERPFEISSESYRACRQFLKKFDNIYTMNYDILLYWALMQNDVDDLQLTPDDGFRAPSGNEDADYVAWESHHSGTVHYLHGALHLFDAGYELRKYTWSRTDLAIIDQVRHALDNEMYPLFVSEGESKIKMARIQHNAYLHRCFRSIGSIGGSVFVFGHSLAENDNHILHQMMSSRVRNIYISVFGGADRAAELEARTEEMNAWVPNGRRKSFYFFDAGSAQVWG